jgi:hypothetical protein
MNEPDPAHLLRQISQIQRMERGKLSIMREGADATHYKHQVWEDGKNVSRHVPDDQAQAVQAAIDGYHQFQELTGQYAQQVIAKTRAELAATSKKKNPNPRSKSSSRRTRKSKGS